METTRKSRSSTVKKCIPCLVHGEYIPLKQLVDPLVKTRVALTDDSDDDDIIDDAWDAFEEALDNLDIQSVDIDNFEDLEITNGVFEFYVDGEDVYARKRK